MIEVDALRKVYPGGVEAVREISFGVEPGEVFGLLGPSGAGKSTTIGMLTTTIAPTPGCAAGRARRGDRRAAHRRRRAECARPPARARGRRLDRLRGRLDAHRPAHAANGGGDARRDRTAPAPRHVGVDATPEPRRRLS